MTTIQNECLLPFVTRPCIYDDRHFWCTFSLNSTEIRRTCNLSSDSSLIFTTHSIELFLIDVYYNQIISRNEHSIEKLIVKPEMNLHEFKYTFKFSIRINWIEIPLSNTTYQIVHIQDNMIPMLPSFQSAPDERSWKIRVVPSFETTYQQIVIENGILKQDLYGLSNDENDEDPDLCGDMFACLNDNPCLFSGHQSLICDIDQLNPNLNFIPQKNTSKYRTLFINVHQTDVNYIHYVDRNTFQIKLSDDSSDLFIENLILIVQAGILEVTADLLNGSDPFHLRIEHGGCDNQNFVFIIEDRTYISESIELINYKTREKEDAACMLDYNNAIQKKRFQPSFLRSSVQFNAHRTLILYFVFTCLGHFQLQWTKNNRTFVSDDPPDISFTSKQFEHQVRLRLKNPFYRQIGNEYRLDVTNEFGSSSSQLKINVTYPPEFLELRRSYLVPNGSDVTLRAIIIGNPRPKIYLLWEHQRVHLHPFTPEPSIYGYILLNVQRNRTGFYEFYAVSTSHHGWNVSKQIYLEVFEPFRAIDYSENVTVEESEVLQLSVNYSNRINRIEWLFNGNFIHPSRSKIRHMRQDSLSRIIVENVSIRDQGQYTAIAYDRIHQKEEIVINVRVNLIAPKIFNCSNYINETTLWIYLSCIFQASYPTVQWIDPQGQLLTNNILLKSINTTSRMFFAQIILKRIPEEKLGTYSFRVSNKANIVDQTFEMKFQDRLPTIIRTNLDGQHHYTMPDENLTFFIDVNGFPFPEVILFRNGKLESSINYTKTEKHFVTKMSNAYEAIFYADVTNRAGSIETNRTFFYPRQPPAFQQRDTTSLSSKIFLKRNETTTLITPQIRRGSPNMTYAKWFVKGKTIISPINLTTSRSELVLEPSLQQNVISCGIENELGQAMYFFILELINGPQWITKLNENINVEFGDNLTLTIEVFSNAKCTIQWFHHSQLISQNQLENRSIGNIFMQSLVITNVNWTDAGNYTVTVENPVDTIYSSSDVRVKSIAKPIVQCSTTEKHPLTTATFRTTTNISSNRETILRVIIATCLMVLIIAIFSPIFCTRKQPFRCFQCRRGIPESPSSGKSDKENSSDGVTTEY